MLERSVEGTRRLVANILNFYGASLVEESIEPRSPDTVDILASSGRDDTADIGIKVFNGKPRHSEYFGPLNSKSVKHAIYLVPMALTREVREKLPATASLLEKEVYVLPVPSKENTDFEDTIRHIVGNMSNRTYFQESEKVQADSVPEGTPELDMFVEQISSQGLSPYIAKKLVYQAAVGGLSIESGTRIRHSLEKIIMRRNENLSREAIFLEALGVLRESERKTASVYPEERTVYLTLDQSENTTRLASQVIAETLESKRDRIVDIISSYPEPFSFIVLVGSLGIFAPKQALPLEMSSYYPLGVTRTTFESENTYLVETIRDIVNTTGITTVDWNRLNTIASYPEINNLVHQFYERFEKIGIGVKGHRGIRRTYIPVSHIARAMGLSDLKDRYNKMELRKFCIWDTILNYKAYQHNWKERLDSLGLAQEDITWALSYTIERRMTSGLLPEGSYMPFAVYNGNSFRHYCIDKMRNSASEILDITW